MILGLDSALPSHTDVCIVGAGPAGLALAFKCASNGLAVTVLEAGTGEDKPDRINAAAPDITTAHHAETSQTAWKGVGGTSRLWGGRCVTFDDLDFERRPHVPYSGWPISHADVARYYGEALEFLGCGSGHTALLAGAPQGTEISTSTVEIWSKQPDLARLHGERLKTAARIKICVGCTAQEVVLDTEGERVVALNVGRGASVDQIRARAFVLAGGGMENARLLLTTQRRWPQKFGGSDGPLGRFYTGHLTGYIAKISFHDRRFAQIFAYRRSSAGAYYRRRLSLSPELQGKHALLNTAFWLDSFSISDPAHGSGALSLAYLALSSLGLYSLMRRGLAPSLAHTEPAAQRMHWGNVRSDNELIASGRRVLSDFIRNRTANRAFALVNPKSRYLLRYHAEQRPHCENRVRLSGGEGAPLRLKVAYSFQTPDIDSVVTSHRLLDDWLRRNDLGFLDYLAEPHLLQSQVFDQALDGYHQIGLTRMSDEPREGIVDGNCRVHGLTNLFVAGSSVFPTSGQANPTLLAVALAQRLADHLTRARLSHL